MRSIDLNSILELSTDDLYSLQRKKGWAMSVIGVGVYWILCQFGAVPKIYKGVCEYFEIGNAWGGISLGYFFICDKQCGDYIKCHEVGHCIQNAAVGGVTMLAYSIASAIRCGWRKVFSSKTSYYDWFFEGDASRIGLAYIEHVTSESKE